MGHGSLGTQAWGLGSEVWARVVFGLGAQTLKTLAETKPGSAAGGDDAPAPVDSDAAGSRIIIYELMFRFCSCRLNVALGSIYFND